MMNKTTLLLLLGVIMLNGGTGDDSSGSLARADMVIEEIEEENPGQADATADEQGIAGTVK